MPHRNKNELTRDFSLRLLSRDILKSYLFARALRYSFSRRKVTAKSRPRPFFFHSSVSQSLSLAFFRPPPFSLPLSLSLPLLSTFRARSSIRQEIATITIGELLSKNRSRFGNFAFLLSRADAGGAGREYQEVAIAGPVWHRMEKGRGPRDE